MDLYLKTFLLDPASYGPGVSTVSHIETHISDIFLAGDIVLKIKKEVRLPFLDFSTVTTRRQMCEREIALNRRYAPQLYDGLITIGRAGNGFNFTGEGEIVEYAVKMRRFRDVDLWSHRAAHALLRDEDFSPFIRRLARFHREAELRPTWGSFETVHRSILRNIAEIPADHRVRAFCDVKIRLSALLAAHRNLIEKRKTTSVRAIHGDLHLGNIAFFQGEAIPFDGIEFSEELGSGDVWSDVAFLTMDLRAHHLPEFSNRVANLYLEESDDFAGVPLLPVYAAHRALVRAKVHILSGIDAEDTTVVDRYLDAAGDIVTPGPLRIIGVGGLSGSGKSTLARSLAKRLDGIVVRTDVVRKHIVGLRPLDIAPESAYTADISGEVYRGLIERARSAAPRGGVIILDGVHHEEWQRQASERLADELHAPFTGLWCSVSKAVALQRVAARSDDASNAHAGIIERQYAAPPREVRWSVVDTTTHGAVDLPFR
ncbi:MAG: phosphotransferase domain [Pseudomonadota bacterium]|jgi:aminoglycoside phosphotransferase family enzyme/predicted kinase